MKYIFIQARAHIRTRTPRLYKYANTRSQIYSRTPIITLIGTLAWKYIFQYRSFVFRRLCIAINGALNAHIAHILFFVLLLDRPYRICHIILFYFFFSLTDLEFDWVSLAYWIARACTLYAILNHTIHADYRKGFIRTSKWEEKRNQIQ